MMKVREARKRKGLTVSQVALLAKLSAGSVSKIERGLLGMSADTARRLADVLDLDPADVMFPERDQRAA